MTALARLWRGTPPRVQAVLLRGAVRAPAVVKRQLAGQRVIVEGQGLDIDAQLVLRAAALTGEPPLEAGSVTDARRRIADAARLSCSRRAPLVSTVPVEVRGEAGSLNARWYRPKQSGASAGLLVFFHGGGFVAGSLDTHDDFCRHLASASATGIVSVDYRLAPEHPFPAAVGDARAAFADIVEAAERLGGDPSRVGVAGDSAGGNLAAVLAVLPEGRPRPACQILIYPWLDLRGHARYANVLGDRFGLTRAELDWYRELYAPRPIDVHDPACSPVAAPDLTHAPPAYILTAGFDPLRDDGELFAAQLRAAGAPVTLRRHAGLMHGFAEALATSRAGREAVAETGSAVQRLLA